MATTKKNRGKNRKTTSKKTSKKTATKVAARSARKSGRGGGGGGARAGARPARRGKSKSPASGKAGGRKGASPARGAAGRARRGAAPDHEGAFRKVFNRVKPLFRKPLDPRIRHMVEIFGEEAVKGLIAAYRKSRETADAELSEAMARASRAPLPHGSFVWHELMTRDVPASKRFYSAMFGWRANDIEMMPGFTYTIFQHLSRDVGGMMAITPEQGEMQPGWLVYVSVDDVDMAAQKAEALGGSIEVPAHDIPVGRWAMVRDPGGAMICMFKARAE